MVEESSVKRILAVPAPVIIHYACRHDSGSRKPRVRWNGVEATRATVQELYCDDCQFEYMQPGCLYHDPRLAEWVEKQRLERRRAEDYTLGKACANCGERITNRSTYCNRCRALLGLNKKKW